MSFVSTSGLDKISAGLLTVGASIANKVEIAASGTTTEVHGPLNVTGNTFFLVLTTCGDLRVNNDMIHIGTDSGVTAQGAASVAIGANAGNTTQGNNSVAIGSASGSDTQAANSVAVGRSSGNLNQGTKSVAIGQNSGRLTQGNNCVAVGLQSGEDGQSTSAIAIGQNAGKTNQGSRAIAIGQSAGLTTQGTDSICIGISTVSTGINSIAIGKNASSGSCTNAIAMGHEAICLANNELKIGSTTMGNTITAIVPGIDNTTDLGSSSIGFKDIYLKGESFSANITTTESTVHIGSEAGTGGVQSASSIAIGHNAGQFGQGTSSIAIGHNAAPGQNPGAIAIGSLSGKTSQAEDSICIGSNTDAQGLNSMAIGANASTKTFTNSIALGKSATSSANDSICIGSNTFTQGENSMAIGDNASTETFTNSIALGKSATSLANNELKIGSTTMENTITAIVPGIDNTTDLGSPSIGFNDLYLGGFVKSDGGIMPVSYFAQTTTHILNNNNTLTQDLFGAGVGSRAVANFYLGQTIQFDFSGTYTGALNNELTFSFGASFGGGGAVFFTTPIIVMPASTNVGFDLTLTCTVRTLGGTGVAEMQCCGKFNYHVPSSSNIEGVFISEFITAGLNLNIENNFGLGVDRRHADVSTQIMNIDTALMRRIY